MKLIGDPHLGREFKANVPLDRRGEREELMFADFEKQLITPDDLIVMVGDLFDSPRVAYHHVLRTIHIIQRHAQSHPKKHYVLMAGNHDISPSNMVGAWELLEAATSLLTNVHTLRKATTLCGVMFFPWEWGKSALEQLNDITLWTDTAVGHWDLVDYGGDTGHLCPAKELSEAGVHTIISGHWHLAGNYNVGGIDVTCTGSMQPMTHAEDPKGVMYVTLTADEYEKADPSTFAQKYVRVVGERGRDVQAPPTCLGFKVQSANEEQQEIERVTLGNFDIQKILDKHLKEKQVPQPVVKEIKEHLGGLS